MLHGLSPSRSLGEIPRIHVSRLADRVSRRCGPLVVTGMADDWPARARWTHELLLEHFGLDDVGHGRALDDGLARDVRFPEIARRRDQANVWLMPDGYVSELHYDLPHNLNTVIRGSKAVVLLPPSETEHLYAGSPFGSVGPQNSHVRLDVDDPRFPGVRDASYWHVDIEEGETLYIPPFHWHHVRSGGESIAVNVWFHLEGALRRAARWPRPVKIAAALSLVERVLRRRDRESVRMT